MTDEPNFDRRLTDEARDWTANALREHAEHLASDPDHLFDREAWAYGRAATHIAETGTVPPDLSTQPMPLVVDPDASSYPSRGPAQDRGREVLDHVDRDIEAWLYEGGSPSMQLTPEQRETTTAVLRSYADYLSTAPDLQQSVAQIRDVADTIDRTTELPADTSSRQIIKDTFRDSGLDYFSSAAPDHMLDVLGDVQLPKYPGVPAADSWRSESQRAAAAAVPTSDLDAVYRRHLDQPGQLRALGAEYDPDHGPAPTVASEQRRTEAFVDDRIGRLRQQLTSPETIYVEVRRDLSSALTQELQRAEAAAEVLAAQGVSKDTLDRHLHATIDASDAVVAGLRDKVFPPTPQDPQQARIAALREQGVPEAAIGAQMRAAAASQQGQGASAQAAAYQPAAAVPPSRIARLAARVTGRSAAQGSAER
jgi:hypothetical protein